MAIQINHLVKKNKFGCNIYYLQLDILHRVEINETTNGTYIVEFFELGIIWPTRLFSFTSNAHIIDIISESMDKVADYYRNSKKYNVPEYVFREDKKQAMNEANSIFNKR
jgi:hypothetical protein